MKTSTWMALPLLALSSAAMHDAAAADSGFYFGLGGGASSYSTNIPGQISTAYAGNADQLLLKADTLDHSDTARQAFIGYRFSEWLAVEIGFQDLGNARTFYSLREIGGPILSPGPALITGEYGLRDANAALVASYPIGDRFELLARGGLVDTRLDYDESGVGVNGRPYSFHGGNTDHIGALAGVGFAWSLSPSWSVRFDADRNFSVGNRFALNADSNGRFDHVDSYTANVVFRP